MASGDRSTLLIVLLTLWVPEMLRSGRTSVRSLARYTRVSGEPMCSYAITPGLVLQRLVRSVGDRAQIRFEGRGYATRPTQSAATLYFTTGDSRYSWLDGTLAPWEGEFNEVTRDARYTAFLQPA